MAPYVQPFSAPHAHHVLNCVSIFECSSLSRSQGNLNGSNGLKNFIFENATVCEPNILPLPPQLPIPRSSRLSYEAMTPAYRPLAEAPTSLSRSNRPPRTSVNLHHVPEHAQRHTEVCLLCSEHHAGCGRIEDGPIPWAPSRSTEGIEMLREDKKCFVEVVEELSGPDHSTKRKSSLWSFPPF